MWQLLTSPRQLGRYRIVRPEIHVVVRDDGTTNFEYVLEKLLTKKKDDKDDDETKSKKTKTPLDVAVEIVDGTLHALDEVRKIAIEQLLGKVWRRQARTQ